MLKHVACCSAKSRAYVEGLEGLRMQVAASVAEPFDDGCAGQASLGAAEWKVDPRQAGRVGVDA